MSGSGEGGAARRTRIVLLAGPGVSSRHVCHALERVGDVVRIVLETPAPATRVLRRRLARVGPRVLAGQLAFTLFARLQRWRSAARRAEIADTFGLDGRPLDEDRITRVASINDAAVPPLLRSLAPDVVIVNGTRIIGAPVLRAVTAPFINTHVGITPLYRGVHGGYWALSEGDPGHCGVTVHVVDEGIDTGEVLYQALIEPTPADNFSTYPLLQTAAALPLLARAVDDARRGELVPRTPDLPSRLWRHPTLWQYLEGRLRRGVR